MKQSQLHHPPGVHIGTSELVIRATSLATLSWTSLYIVLAAGVAFMLGTSEYLLVYHTSGLTLSIAGVFKVSLCMYIRGAICATSGMPT